MCDYVAQAVEHYQKMAGVSSLKKATTPFCPDGVLLEENDDAAGELGDAASSVLMKVLWAARLARPDLSRPVGKMASHVQKWSRNDDRRLKRLIEYMNSTKHSRLDSPSYHMIPRPPQRVIC